MTNLSSEICLKLRDARRAAKLSQSEVAREVGCKQSAISMFEQGDPTKLNAEVVRKLAAKFGVELPTETSAPNLGTIAVRSAPHAAYCPNPHCPSNHAYEVEGRRLYLPDREAADPVGGKFCALCGEVLERRCPNCGAIVHAGAICSNCGESYIAVG